MPLLTELYAGFTVRSASERYVQGPMSVRLTNDELERVRKETFWPSCGSDAILAFAQ
jgi:hypothetical protein